MRNSIRWPVLSLALLALAVSPLAAQEGGEGGSEDMAAMMQAFQAAMTPGAPHEHLATGTGKWNLAVKMYMDPSQAPMESTSTSEREMILGGRVLVETVKGDVMGTPFHGIGHTGYDNVTGRYWSTWTDSMSTGVLTFWGTMDEESGTLTMEGEAPDPLTGEMKRTKSVSTSKGGKEWVTFYEDRGGQEVKTMELVYTRASE